MRWCGSWRIAGTDVFAAPGNPGMAGIATCLQLKGAA